MNKGSYSKLATLKEWQVDPSYIGHWQRVRMLIANSVHYAVKKTIAERIGRTVGRQLDGTPGYSQYVHTDEYLGRCVLEFVHCTHNRKMPIPSWFTLPGWYWHLPLLRVEQAAVIRLFKSRLAEECATDE